ncbi:MAG: YeeE/YedE thiosulfate transporter family protein, partial [Alphaproteobacteria bacterium]
MDLQLAAEAATTMAALFGVGVAFGVVAERSAFCTMGAVADVVLFGGWRRARLWAAAIATAVLVVQVGTLAGWVSPGAGAAWRAETPWLALAGGALFGAGMV